MNKVSTSTRILTFVTYYHEISLVSETITIKRQTNRIIKKRANTFQEEDYRTEALLDIFEAFEKIWHFRIRFKLKIYFPMCIVSSWSPL